jgi:DNA repair exonuclease SbcCD ATPase subunit
MIMTPALFEGKVNALLGVLDSDIQHLQTVLRQLDRLRSLLIKRDDAGLENLLADLSSHAETRAANEQERQHLRQELADGLECSLEQVTLSRLAKSVPDAQRSAVSERQKALKSLAERLKREHALTAALVADCARFNRSLLRLFFGQNGRGAISYGANGAPVRGTAPTLMSLHL